jgi:type IV pilus assembly protein PilY1
MKIRNLFSGFCQGLVLSLGFVPSLWSPLATAANLSGALQATYSATPIEIVQNVPPLVMLTMSMDHQYWLKAYNDYTDLTGDGDIERTYDDTFTYYGYFHSERCYTYTDASTVFAAVGVAGGANKHYCDGALDTAWSGNFLNWATMTRMDIVRKILYGGYRTVATNGDTATSTILERAHLPGDAHSFAKYYNGADINSLVPSSYGSLKVDKANGGDNDGIDDANEGITLCNISYKSSGSSQGVANNTPVEPPNPAPMMRVVKENFQLWNSNERRQCTWDDENGDNANSNNSAESGIFADGTDPASSKQLKTPGNARDHVVRVKTCESTFFDSNRNLENCKTYGSNLKPEGLLQRYGLDGQVKFGLMTGSYARNISGGVLRKAVGALSDEINVTNGTFIDKSGTTQTGIIRTLNAVRIYGYGYTNGTYLSGDGGDNCTFQLSDIVEGNCRSWGNPISEIYLESLRYFALSSGRTPTGAFSADDSSSILGLVNDVSGFATDPLTTDNFCASLNSIVFNASVSSYDNDSSVYGSTFGDVAATTKTVGDGITGDAESIITGKNFFIGRAGTGAANTNEFCTSKTVASLGDASGLCPEAPTVRGSFFMAGLAHYAHTNDLRTNVAFKGDQTVNTFAVSLATSTPIIEVPIGANAATASSFVKLLPAYRLRTGGNNSNETSNNPLNDGGGALVDFRIVVPHTEVASAASTTPATGTGHFYAKFYINWEDSEQGGDYDQDMWGTLEYRVNKNVSPATIQVITKSVAQSTGIGQLFGFVTNGTTQDGFHAYSGIQGANYFSSVGTDPTGVPGCTNCRAISEGGGQSGARSHTFTVNPTTSADILESPLYYAAKWGGFDDSDPKNKKPDLKTEWDVKDISGNFVTGGDGIPDNFFFVTNPGALEDALTTIFNTILERVSSGTSAAVVANDRIGNGALFQAVYDPIKKDSTSALNEAKWIGTLHGLWVDDQGFIREDAGVKGKLEGYNTDQVVELFYDDTARRTKLRRFTSTDDKVFKKDTTTPGELNTLRTIWNARERLSALSDGTITSQRAYTAVADTGRHILTWSDADTDGAVDSNETVALTSANVSSNTINFRLLDTDTTTNAQRLVDWTRGLHTGMTEFRPRLLDYAGDGTAEVLRLGDIVHSTPISVSAPREAFDVVFGDDSYRDFRKKYVNRRQVVYVGANDGMIHAFNAGFFNVETKTFDLKTALNETSHPLGSELWAYVPKNLLPHLQWAARKDYSHVYYMDGPPRVFDVKIFDSTKTAHPGGWGTILVATMGYGGGADDTSITVDTAADGIGGADATPRDNIRTKSAVVILDVTDPESPPVVLAELNPGNLQFTTSGPQAVVINNQKESGTTNKWFLVMGTGPSNLASGAYISGASNAELFVYDLSKLGEGLDNVATGAEINGLVKRKALPVEGSPDKNKNVFIGDVTGIDYDFNYKSDAIYFGTVGPASDVATVNQGSLFRVSMKEDKNPDNWIGPFPLITGINQPFASAPTLQFDDRLRHWVMAASGRFEVTNDRATVSKQTLYGVVDPLANNSSATSTGLTVSNLVDVSNARVFFGAGGNVNKNGISLDGDANTEHTFKSLRALILSKGGWKRDFVNSTTKPSERGVSGMTALGGVILVPAFTPDTALCTAEGSSTLLGLSFETGTATAKGVFGDIPCDCSDKYSEVPPTPMEKNDAGTYQVVRYEGKLEKPSVTRNASSLTDNEAQAGPTGGRACGTTSTAAIACNAVNFQDQIFNGEISWREQRDTQ